MQNQSRIYQTLNTNEDETIEGFSRKENSSMSTVHPNDPVQSRVKTLRDFKDPFILKPVIEIKDNIYQHNKGLRKRTKGQFSESLDIVRDGG